jgi:hypothetical protein
MTKAKAHQAIGQYFSEFSELERELGEAVKVVLHLEDHPAADIVVAALRYPSTKASLVRAATEIARKKDGSETSPEWKAKADETLGEISKHCYGSRNTLAHSLLEPQEDGSVKVTSRTLSGSGQMTPGEPKTWNLNDEINDVRRLTKGLREIRAELSDLEVVVGKIHWAGALFGEDPRRYLQPPYDQTQGPLGPLEGSGLSARAELPTKSTTSAGEK